MRMLWCTFLRFRSLRRRCSQHIAIDRNPVLPSEHVCPSIAQYLRLLPTLSSISQFPSLFLLLSVFEQISACFMSRQSTRARQSTRSCLACETGEIVCFWHQKCYPSNIFQGSAPNPAGGLHTRTSVGRTQAGGALIKSKTGEARLCSHC